MRTKQVLGGRESVRVAIAQVSPVYLDLKASVQRAVESIAEAAKGGADLVVFGETWLAGYPYWTEGWETDLGEWTRARIAFRDAAVLTGDEICDQLSAAARVNNIHVVMGANEIDDVIASSTIYNTLLFFDRDGEQYGRHRKLMPTFTERMFWGAGDERDIQVFNTDIGRMGALICGEHLMPLTRASMISLGEDIHIAAFPGAFALHTGPQLESPEVDGCFWGHSSVRNHAFEAGAFVVSACAYVDKADVSDDFPFKESMNISYATGGSSVISPLGVPLVEPTSGSKLVYADCPAWMIKATKAIVDAAGHYARPDVFRLQIRDEGSWSNVGGQTIPNSVLASDLEREAEQYEVDSEDVREIADDLKIAVRR